MTDRPILFSAPMIRALRAGTKTQTRRILKPQPAELTEGQAPKALRISAGDRLWVRESFIPDPPSDDPAWDDHTCTYVEWSGCGARVSDVPKALRDNSACIFAADGNDHDIVWCSPLFMPRWASRLTLLVDDVKVERLQDITEADAIAEGAPLTGDYSLVTGGPMIKVSAGVMISPGAWYRRLWTDINGPASWDANPFVAAYTFRVLRGNIDKLEGTL